MIHRKLKWCLLALASLAALVLSVQAGVAAIKYFLLSRSISLKVYEWEILEQGSDFYIQGAYTYEFQGKTWQGKGIFGPPELNPYAAQRQIEKMPCPARGQGWCRAGNPSISAPSKQMPWNAILRALVCWALTVYFSLLRTTRYVLCQSSKKNQVTPS